MNFTEEQIEQIEANSDDKYVWEITNKIKADPNVTLPEESIEALFNRLKETYRYLKELKFYKETLIEAFLYGEAVTPGYKNDPTIKSWVEKENETPEYQYEDLLIIAEKKQQGLL